MKKLLYISLLFLAGCTIKQPMVSGDPILGATILFPYQGGTGIGSATAGQVGTCIKVLDDSPFTYELGTCGSGGGTGSNWDWGTPQNFIKPSTTVGIIVSASSTIAANLNITGRATTSGLVIGTTNPPITPIPTGDLYFSGNATSGSNIFATGVFLAGDGDTALPSFTFINDRSSGFYLANPGSEVAFVAGGVEIVTFQTTGLVVNNSVTTTNSLSFNGELFPDGTSCSNGQILKKTGPDDWDCSSDTGGGFNGAWESIFANTALTPTNTSAGIFIRASSTIAANFRVDGNSTTTATSTVRGLKVENLISCNTIDTTAEGHFICGSDATGGGSGSNWDWGANQLFIKPSTTVGIIVSASSTINANFNVSGNATTSGYQVIGTTQPTINLSAGDLLVGGSIYNPFGYIQTSDNAPQIDLLENDTGETGSLLMSGGNLRISAGSQADDYVRFMDSIDLQGVGVASVLVPTAHDQFDIGSATKGWAGLWLGPDECISFNGVECMISESSDDGNQTLGHATDLILQPWNTLSSGRVGIGTTSPLAIFSVATTTRDALVPISSYSTSTDSIALLIDSFGRVGIGGTKVLHRDGFGFTVATTTKLLAATSTNLGVTSLAVASCDVKATAAGDLYCGTDSAGSGTYPFTETDAWGQSTSATSSTLWLQDTPFSLFASSTSVFDFATTSALTITGTLFFDSLAFDSLTDDATLDNNSGDLRVVDVTCTDCLNATEIEDIYLLNNGDSGSGVYIWSGLNHFQAGQITTGSSTQIGNFGIQGTATVTAGLIVGTTVNRPAGNNPISGGDLFVGGDATTSGASVVGATVGATQADFDFGAGDFYANGDVFFGADATTTGNFSFNGEIMPDGLECSDGQILKKTGANNWDCAADASGSGSYSFTETDAWGQSTSATSSTLWLRGSPFSLFASSTSVFDYATATALTITQTLYFDSLAFDSLTDDATLDNNSGDLRVVDVTCTDCLNATEIEDIYLLIAGDTSSGTFTWSGAHTFDTQAVTINSSIALDTNGITIDTDGDGAVTITGASAGNDESLTFNFDDFANAVIVTSASGVTYMDWGSIGYVTQASSTIIGNFKVEGTATVTAGLIIGTTVNRPAGNNPISGGDLFVAGKSTTSVALTVGSAVGANNAALNFTGGDLYVQDAAFIAGSATTSGHFNIDQYLSVTGAASSTITHSLVIDTSVFVVNANDNTIGIGTASPSTTLGVLGNSRFNGFVTSTNNLWIGDTTNGGLFDVLANGWKYFGTAKPVKSFDLTAGGARPTIGDSGSATTTQNDVLYTTNRQVFTHLDFPLGATNTAQWLVHMPDNYDGGTVSAVIHHTATTTSGASGNVKWCLRGVSLADNDALDATWGSFACWSGQAVATLNTLEVSTSTTVTIGGTPAAGEDVVFMLARDSTTGNDNSRVNFGRALKVIIEFSVTGDSE